MPHGKLTRKDQSGNKEAREEVKAEVRARGDGGLGRGGRRNAEE